MWSWTVVISFLVITYTHSVKFGPDNRYTCHCNNDEQCNQETGVCCGDCATGWSGTSCQKQNVALGKPSSQVTTMGVGSSPSLVVDGDRSTTIYNKCIDTGIGDFTRWWRVDLKDDYPITDITIFYQSDPSRVAPSLTGYSVHVSKENQGPELCFKDKDPNNKPSVNNITCDQTITGRYVNISNLHSSKYDRYLVLCEVEIYVCSVGTFGSDCNNLCHCLNNERCSENGQCTGGCADGWSGTTCSQKCPSGSYGEGCNNQCSVNCKNSSDCHHVSGKCTDGCKPGYKDDQCLQSYECNDHIWTIVGTLLGLIIGLVAGAVGVLFIMKRRSSSKSTSPVDDTVTSNRPSDNVTTNNQSVTQPSSNISNHPVTQPSSNTSNPSVTQPPSNTSNSQDEYQYIELDTIYQNENDYAFISNNSVTQPSSNTYNRSVTQPSSNNSNPSVTQPSSNSVTTSNSTIK